MSTKVGNQAEQVAADYLKSKGFKIIGHNWRRPKCEIDIVASKQNSKRVFDREKTIFFVEVKYRSSDQQGSGLDYITSTKLKQMKFAAQMWVDEYQWPGMYTLAAIEVTGKNFNITEFIENIII